jgi:hypothetical protein
MKRSHLDGYSLEIEQGTGTVVVHLEKVQLISGAYFVEAWFLDEMDSMTITTKSGRSDWFTVKGAAMTYDGNAGIYEPLGWWEHLRNE